MIKAGIIGASGYAGCELLRILLMHPEAEVSAISSDSYTGKKIYDLYPCLLYTSPSPRDRQKSRMPTSA